MDSLRGQSASPQPRRRLLRDGLFARTKSFGPQFWNFFLASIFFDLGMFVFSFLYNLYLLDCGLNEKTMGWIAGAASLGTMLATIPAGALTRKIGLRNALLCCLFVLPLVSAGRALVQGEIALVTLAFLGGAGFALWAVSLPPVVARLTTAQNRSLGFSLIFALGIGSGILGGYLGGHVPAWLSTLEKTTPAGLKQLSLLLACVFVLAGMIPCFRLKIQAEAPSQVRRRQLDSSYLWHFLPPVALWSFGLGVLSPFVSVYMTKGLRLALPQVGNMFSLSQFLQMISVLLAPQVFRKLGTLRGVTLSQAATSFALVAFVAFSNWIWMLTAFAAMSLFQYMNEPGLYSLLMNNVSPEDQSRASAWNFFVICGAQSVAAISGGVLLVRFGYTSVLLSVGLLMALSAAALFYSLRSRTASAQSATPSSERELDSSRQSVLSNS